MFYSTVLLLIFGAATAELCGDVDTTLCNMMINRIQDTCSDPCLSKFCKHSCGMCGMSKKVFYLFMLKVYV